MFVFLASLRVTTVRSIVHCAILLVSKFGLIKNLFRSIVRCSDYTHTHTHMLTGTETRIH